MIDEYAISFLFCKQACCQSFALALKSLRNVGNGSKQSWESACSSHR